MSILLTGVEMPEKKGLWVVIHPDGTVEYNTGDEGWKTLKRSATHVQPHGDLIDQDEYRDEFMNGVYALCSDDSDNYRANAIIDLFDAAPTIIPATEKERGRGQAE